jgi:excisionase family DNA binding protein
VDWPTFATLARGPSSIPFIEPTRMRLLIDEGTTAVKHLANPDYDPAVPLQTKRGAKQALRIGHNGVEDMIRQGRLKAVKFGRSVRITTESILQVAATGAER